MSRETGRILLHAVVEIHTTDIGPRSRHSIDTRGVITQYEAGAAAPPRLKSHRASAASSASAGTAPAPSFTTGSCTCTAANYLRERVSYRILDHFFGVG